MCVDNSFIIFEYKDICNNWVGSIILGKSNIVIGITFISIIIIQSRMILPRETLAAVIQPWFWVLPP